MSHIIETGLNFHQTEASWLGIHKNVTAGIQQRAFGSSGTVNYTAPPPPPNIDDATTAARQSQDFMRQRRGVLANIYAGNTGVGGTSPSGGAGTGASTPAVKSALGT